MNHCKNICQKISIFEHGYHSKTFYVSPTGLFRRDITSIYVHSILGHPNVKVFWAHGGNLGSIEAAHCAVPTVVTPIYGDQFLNGATFEKRGMGFVLLYKDINADNIYEKITKCLNPE